MLFPIKAEETILQEMMQELKSSSNIKNFNPGSIARTLLEIINRHLNDCYESINIYSAQTFLSTAGGMYLDMIGEMLACRRISNEDDDSYRYRISQQVFAGVKANETSIRLKCLSIPGVKDILITPFVNGPGSFVIHVLTDELEPSDALINVIKSIVKEEKAEGIMVDVLKPKLVKIDMEIGSSNELLAPRFKEDFIKLGAQRYLDGLNLGGNIVFSDILRIAQEELDSPYIRHISVNNSNLTSLVKYKLDWDSRAYIDNITISRS